MSQTQEQAENTKKQSEVNPEEAAEILASAVAYCQKAGIQVQHANENGTLWLAFPGLEIVPLDNGKVEIRFNG